MVAVLLTAAPTGLYAADAAKPINPPNIVYVLADDLGGGDLRANGGSIPTPNIDRLFAQGIRLDNFMGWWVCSPTRAMLFTGRHPFRVGTGPEVGGELAREETTIAEAFKAHGYRTGVFGEWHNGEDPDTPEYRAAFAEAFKDMPNKWFKGGLGANEHGFDEAWVYYGGGADYFTRRTVNNRGPVSWWHNREFRPQDAGYTKDFITQHATEFIREASPFAPRKGVLSRSERRPSPFFCYVPFHIVHIPLQAKDADLKDVDPKVRAETRRIRADADVQEIDVKALQAGLGETKQVLSLPPQAKASRAS
jgi:arylsulfatase A-like enzyme